MNEVVLQIIENCDIDFDSCWNDTCPLFAECEQWQKENRPYIKLTVDEIPDEAFEGTLSTLEQYITFDALTNEQLDIFYDMTEEDKIKFENDFEDRALELLQKRIDSRRNKQK